MASQASNLTDLLHQWDNGVKNLSAKDFFNWQEQICKYVVEAQIKKLWEWDWFNGIILDTEETVESRRDGDITLMWYNTSDDEYET